MTSVPCDEVGIWRFQRVNNSRTLLYPNVVCIRWNPSIVNRAIHKVLTYVEYRALSAVFQNIDPPPPLHPGGVSSPRTKGGGYTLAEQWGGGGVNILKDARHWIGLLHYIPLWGHPRNLFFWKGTRLHKKKHFLLFFRPSFSSSCRYSLDLLRLYHRSSFSATNMCKCYYRLCSKLRVYLMQNQCFQFLT